jgi:phosphatidylglycerol:prolipoprotein diacylglycerol transferase
MMLSPLAALYNTFDPFVFRISGEFGVRWYGLSYILAFVIAYLLMTKLARSGRPQLTVQRIPDAMLALIAGVIIGGRVGYCLFYEPQILTSFTSSFPFWGLFQLQRGGMSFHGGLSGVIIAAWWFARGTRLPDGTRRDRIPLMHFFDVLALCTPIGLGLGRLANFINGELLGKIVTAPGQPAPWWAVKFPHELTSGQALVQSPEQMDQIRSLAAIAAPGEPDPDVAVSILVHKVLSGNHALAQQLEPFISARHPSQMYQLLAEGLFTGLVLWIAAMPRWNLFPKRSGVIGCLFMICYGCSRILTELFRLPDSQLAVKTILGLSRGQWFSVAMIIVGANLMFWCVRRSSMSGSSPKGVVA